MSSGTGGRSGRERLGNRHQQFKCQRTENTHRQIDKRVRGERGVATGEGQAHLLQQTLRRVVGTRELLNVTALVLWMVTGRVAGHDGTAELR